MIRWLGALLILAACGWCGRLAASRLEQRRQRLIGAQLGLAALAKEISFLHTALAPACRVAALCAGAAAPLFLATAERLEVGDGCGGEEAWQAGLLASRSLWHEEARIALATLGPGLGQQDNDLQLRHVELTRLRLQDCENQAHQLSLRFGKLYNSLGWLCGLVLVLLLV